MTKLLPCPFCGSIRSDLGTSQDAGITKWSVICPNCGSSCSLYCDSEHDAVELWNMRTDPQALAATPAVGGELQDIADEIEQSDGIALMLTGCSKQLGIRRTAMVIAALRAQPALMGEPDLTHYEADAESVLAVSPLPAVGGEAIQAILEDEVYLNRHESTYDYGDAVARILALFAQPASPLRGRERYELAEFLCEKLALESFDSLSREKYLGDAKAILEFLSAPPEQLATNDLTEIMKLAGDNRVSSEALGIRLRALWTSNR